MTSAGPSVSAGQDAAGNPQIGLVIEGVFVPFVTKNAQIVYTKVEQGKAAAAEKKSGTKGNA